MPDSPRLIPPYSTIGIANLFALQTWNVLWSRMYDLFHFGYLGNPCSLPFINSVGRTIEFTPHPGPSYWGNSYNFKPIRMVSGGVSAPPALRWGI